MNHSAVTIPMAARSLTGTQRTLYITLALFAAQENTFTEHGEIKAGQWAGNWSSLAKLSGLTVHQARHAADVLVNTGWISWRVIRQRKLFMLFSLTSKGVCHEAA